MAQKDLIKPEKVLKIGQRVEISLASDADENFYNSRVEDFNTEYLVVAMPMDKGYPIIPYPNEVVYGRLRTNEGVYKFVSVFLDKAAKPIPVLRLSMPKELEKHQQREFVRVETMFSVKVCLQDENKKLLSPYHTITKDISGGGLRFVMDKELPSGTYIQIETEPLSGVGILNLPCEVVRSIKPIATENKFWVGAKFIDLPKATERNLIRFIFQKQRELLSKRISN